MPDFNVRSDSVNVEQIMEQIRARIREKRGVDYTEQQIRELAAVKLEKFLDPRGVRSDLLNEFRRVGPDQNYAFEDDTLFRSTRGPIQWIRRLLQPVLKLFFNPNPLIHVLHLQSQINELNARRHPLYYELMHNLVVEVTELGIEVKNLKMRVETLTSRNEFNERRARALEGAVMYRPAQEERDEAPVEAPTTPPDRGVPIPVTPAGPEGPGQRSRRRRRRRGRRGGAPATSIMGSQQEPAASVSEGGRPAYASDSAPRADAQGLYPAARSDRSGPSPSTLREPQGPEQGRGTTGSGPGGIDDEQ